MTKKLAFTTLFIGTFLLILNSVSCCVGASKIENRCLYIHRFTGFSKIKNSKINKLRGVGNCQIVDSEIGISKMTGRMAIENSQVLGPTRITGSLRAKSVKFHDTIRICSERADFENCLIHTIVFVKNNHTKEEILTLKNTEVLGEVIFESGAGRVIKDENSSFKATGLSHCKEPLSSPVKINSP